jgi:ADP-ribose diphosphatase
MLNNRSSKVMHSSEKMFMPKQPPPRVLSQQWLHHSRLFHIEQLELQFSNGAERHYERINPGFDRAVMVVPMLDADTVLLVREYGAGVGGYYLSLPKGAMETGEDACGAANRELMEEVGYGARQLTVVKQLALSPSYMGNRITIVLAQQLYPQQLEGDEPEPLELVPYPLAQLETLVAATDFTEAYVVAALYMVRDRLAGQS